MKRPLKTKEAAFILLPVLGLGAFAWYQQRVEQIGLVTDSRRTDGIVVSSIEVHPAKGRFQSEGLSHELKITVDHSWPRPAWWGSWNIITNVDPLLDIRQQVKQWRVKPQKYLAYGGVLTTTSTKNGKPILKVQWRDNRIGTPFLNNQLIISHEIALDKIPTSAGEVTFRGLYLIAGREPLRITRVVRKAGEAAHQKPDRNPHGRIVSIKAGKFFKDTTGPGKAIEDRVQIDFVVSRTIQKTEKAWALLKDLELHDGRGQVLIPYETNGFHMNGSSNTGGASNINAGGQSIGLRLDSTLKTTNPLVLKGKVCIDEAWPIPFSVRLPNR